VKVVVSGASGFIGSALVPALEAQGHEVVRLVRREPQTRAEIAWDPAAGSLDAGALQGIDAIVNLSGENVGKRWTDSRKREIHDSHVHSMQLLATTAAALAPKPSAFVCAGGIDVYGDRGDEILTEESPLGEGFLAEVGRAKEAASQPARDAGIRVVNFRQGIVLAKHGGALQRMLPFFRLGAGGRVASGKQWWSWVALDDVTAAYTFALGSDLAGPVNLCAPNPVTNDQFTKALGRALRRPTIFPAPEFAVRALYGQMGVEVLITRPRVLPAHLLDAGFEFSLPTIDAALARALAQTETRFSPARPAEVGLVW
jgi:uncharacterized protein (TIGR01777 family)